MPHYRLTTIERLTTSTILMSMRPDDPSQALRFEAGQYAAINFYRGHRRTAVRVFSIVSAPDEGQLQFALRLSGPFTRTASRLRPGDRIEVYGPFGEFTLDQAQRPDMVGFAGGIGVTPFISLMRSLAKVPNPPRLTLIYSCRTQDDIPFEAELQQLAARYRNLRVIWVISRGPIDKLSGQAVLQGQLSPQVIDRLLNDDYTPYHFYICGPKSFMRTVQRNLAVRGVLPERIASEEFGVRAWSLKSLTSSPALGVYAGTAAGFVIMLIAVMGIDVRTTLAKAHLVNTTTSSSSQTTTPQATTSQTTTTSSSSSDATTTTTPTTQSSDYQMPTSSVS